MCTVSEPASSESALFAQFVYKYKESDALDVALVSLLHTVPRTVFRRIDRNRHTAKNMDNTAEQRLVNITHLTMIDKKYIYILHMNIKSNNQQHTMSFYKWNCFGKL